VLETAGRKLALKVHTPAAAEIYVMPNPCLIMVERL
jgi:hypothetical protein